MMKKFSIILLWLASVVLISLYTYENPEIMDKAKDYFKRDKNLVILQREGEIFRKPGNSFIIEISEVVSFSQKTAFIIHDKEILNFDKDNLRIYFQNGYYFNNSKLEKISLPKSFTILKNGGIKSIFIYKDKQFALISSLNNGCYYASIVLIDQSKEIFNTQCLPKKKNRL